MRRREDDEINAAELAASSPFGLHRNPGAAGVWVTHTFKVFPAPPGHPLIEMGPPVNVEWYAEGRRATRAEVEASIAGGLPELEAMVDQERPEDRPLARAELARAREALAGWLPVEGA